LGFDITVFLSVSEIPGTSQVNVPQARNAKKFEEEDVVHHRQHITH